MTRAAFARPNPAANRSPASSLVFGPPTPMSHVPIGLSWFCSQSTYSVDERLFLAGPRVRPWTRTRRRLVTGSPDPGLSSEKNMGLPGSWVVLFHACRSQITPRRVRAHLAMTVNALLPSEPYEIVGTREFRLSRLVPCGPRGRSPSYRPWRCPHQAPGSLPTCQAWRWSGGVRTHQTTSRVLR
jgi:hypothetical protein